MKKYISSFVKRMREIDSLHKNYVLWDSTKYGTYRKSQRGELVDVYYLNKGQRKSSGALQFKQS